MGRKRKYKNAAEKQKAWRIRHGQVKKVPLAIRKGEKLGGSEALLRGKKKGETWEEYHKYIENRVEKARAFKSEQVPIEDNGEDSIGAKRATGKYKEPTMGEEYYELRRKYEEDLEKLKTWRKLKRK